MRRPLFLQNQDLCHSRVWGRSCQRARNGKGRIFHVISRYFGKVALDVVFSSQAGCRFERPLGRGLFHLTLR
jgi:hypothetical protein